MANDFQRQLKQSHKYESQWETIYRQKWPNIKTIARMSDGRDQWQLRGVDVILILTNGKQIFIDEKVRETSYDDILLEIYSDHETQKDGWTIDESKWTDYIAYAIPALDTCYLLPADLLRRATLANLDTWLETYVPIYSVNPGYQSLNIAISYQDLTDAMNEQMKQKWEYVHPGEDERKQLEMKLKELAELFRETEKKLQQLKD